MRSLSDWLIESLAVGLVMMAATRNVTTYAAAQVNISCSSKVSL